MIKINKLTLNNFRFFTDDKEHNSFELNGKNMLVYGENGSGKSSLFRAFEFLAQTKINKEEFGYSKNIFGTQPPSLVFELDNSQTLTIDENHLENNLDYIKALSIFKPMLEYKNLLKIHYQTDKSKDEINIYEMLRDLFKEYPISQEMKIDNADLVGLNRLGEIKTPNLYFHTLKEILNTKVIDDINAYLWKFNKIFHINTFFFDMEFTEDGKVEFVVNVKIDFMNNLLDTYHHFLNEAKLTALALAIHFAIIRNVSDKLENNGFKLLILDDLLISLDMSNRLNLIDLLKTEFNDFQIFFFTHDKALFEIFKDKMSWRAYEIYVDEHEEGFEIPFVKKSNSLIEQAKYQKHQKNYDCSANLLRQYTEKLLCKFLPADKLVNKNCKQLDLNGLLQNAVAYEKSKEVKRETIITILESLKTYRNTVLNPAAHYDDVNVYKSELHNIILALDELESKISI